jgi:cell division protein FtsB
MKWLAFLLIAVVVLTQYRLWLSPDGWREATRLEQSVDAQKAENDRLQQRNQQLAAEVRDLKQGFNALEERARSELGMIGRNETFFQVVAPRKSAVPAEPAAAVVPPTRTAAAR